MAQTGLSISLDKATRAALRDAAGQGSEKGPVSESERARLRAKSLGWLRAHLELTAKMRNDGQAVIGLLTSWQTDPALASVRDPAELAKLPAGEREQWQRLWADVAAQVAADPLVQGGLMPLDGNGPRPPMITLALKRGPADDGHFWLAHQFFGE